MVQCGTLLRPAGGRRGDASVHTGGLKGGDRVSWERCIVTRESCRQALPLCPNCSRSRSGNACEPKSLVRSFALASWYRANELEAPRCSIKDGGKKRSHFEDNRQLKLVSFGDVGGLRHSLSWLRLSEMMARLHNLPSICRVPMLFQRATLLSLLLRADRRVMKP